MKLMQLKRFWDFYARVYDLLRTFSPYVKIQKKVVEHLELIPNLAILDVSCGTGNTIEELIKTSDKPWGMKIFGLDQSGAMLTRAKKKIGNNASFFSPGTYDNIPGDEQYDRIISVNGLYASANPDLTLKHWYNRLENGGLLVISNPFLPKQGPVWREYFQDMWRNKDIIGLIKFLVRSPIWLLFIMLNQYLAKQARQKIFHFLAPDDLKAFLVSIGFKILRQEIVYGGGSILISVQKDEGAPVRRAQRPVEIESISRLRYNIYCTETNMVDSAKCRGNQEIDRFDRYATHFIARNQDQIVGSVRYFTDAGQGFLLEEYFFLPPEIKSPEVRRITVEISRATLIPEYRGGPLFFLLLEQAVRHGLKMGYSIFIGASTKKIWDSFRANKWKVKRWTGYISYHNTQSAPAMFRPPFENFENNANQNYFSSSGSSIFDQYFSWCSSF